MKKVEEIIENLLTRDKTSMGSKKKHDPRKKD